MLQKRTPKRTYNAFFAYSAAAEGRLAAFPLIVAIGIVVARDDDRFR